MYVLLYERIRLSSLDTGGSRDRYLAIFLKGQIAISGGTEGDSRQHTPAVKQSGLHRTLMREPPVVVKINSSGLFASLASSNSPLST